MSPSRLQKFVHAFVGVALAGSAWCAPGEEEELALAFGDKSFVTIATGTRVPLMRAPAVASVITAEDIKALGATDLDQVLETVPGLHVARGTLAHAPVYAMRGIHRDTNPQVLMLVNGIPMTTSFSGDRGNVWGGLPLENVARIEVIRGPGSAVYGADAFAGVINIMTKDATDIGGTQFGARAGSFHSRDGWVLHGGKLGPLQIAAYLRVGSTEGSRRTIDADAQTGLDQLLGTRASHAPGPLNDGRNVIDGTLDLSYHQWRLRLGYKERDRVGSGVGIAQALDPTGRNYSERLTADLGYREPHFARNWEVSLEASFMRYKEFSDLVLFPPGTNLGGGVFSDGMIGNPYKWERHGRINAAALYDGFQQHRLRLGVGAALDDLYKVRESKNFLPGVLPFTPIGTGSLADVTDVSDTAPFLRPHKRRLRYAFVQDEWSFAKDWTLTAGLRHDHYSDFGHTSNPRLALAWEAAYNLTARLLYGTAFRAPSFVELYAINNPVQVGMPSLKPEKMQSVEGVFSWQATPRLHVGVNLFRYRMREVIQLVGTTWQNAGQQTGRGAEIEAVWDPRGDLRLTGGYGLQRSIDEATRQESGLVPRHRLYLRGDLRFSAGWSINAQLNMVGKRWRAPGDARANLDGYNTVDVTVRNANGAKGWGVAVSVRNLFDADAREPSPAGAPFVALPNDLPLARRSMWIQATRSF
jgi:iron complex outermembrane receptor protein